MEFDFKVTVWRRVTVPTHLEELVLEKIKDGTIATDDDLYEFTDSLEEIDGLSNEFLLETAESVTPKQVEVLNDSGEIIYKI